MRFGKAARILRRREFLAVQQRGQRVFAGKLVVLALHAGGRRPRRYSSMRVQSSRAGPSVIDAFSAGASPTVAIPSTLPARKKRTPPPRAAGGIFTKSVRSPDCVDRVTCVKRVPL